MKQFGKILKFELKGYMRNKVFVGITIFLVVAIAVVMFIPNIIAAFESDEGDVTPTDLPTMLVYAEDENLSAIVKEYFGNAFVDYNVKVAEGSVDELKNDIISGNAECAFVMNSASSYTYYVNNLSMYDSNTAIADTVLQEVYRINAMVQNGLTPEQAGEIMSVQIESGTETLGKDQMQNFFYTYIMIFALYMVILLYGQMVATNVATEKSSRAMEVLVTSAKPTSMMFGKVLASCIAGFSQLVLVFGKDDSEPSDETEEEDLEDLEYWSEQGDETQMYLLGKKYLDEYDDPEEAEHWLKKASENGNEYAMYLLYKCYRDGRIEDKENEKMKYLKMALNKGYDAAEYEYGKLLREKEPEEAMKYFKKAADQRNPYAAYAYAKMCSDRGDISSAKIYFRIAASKNADLRFHVGLWYFYDQGEHKIGKDYLKYAAAEGNIAAEKAFAAIIRGYDARLFSGVLNLFRHVSHVIDNRAREQVKGGRIDRKRLRELREKQEGLGMRMG